MDLLKELVNDLRALSLAQLVETAAGIKRRRDRCMKTASGSDPASASAILGEIPAELGRTGSIYCRAGAFSALAVCLHRKAHDKLIESPLGPAFRIVAKIDDFYQRPLDDR